MSRTRVGAPMCHSNQSHPGQLGGAALIRERDVRMHVHSQWHQNPMVQQVVV
jgi:hypothetical protein